MGEAFDAACQELHDKGQPQLVYEVIARRIIDAAKKGERDPVQLRNVGLAGLGFDKGDQQVIDLRRPLLNVRDRADNSR
jgi:hypothetical protein